jgi:RNA polymerase sigma-70 factor (ECF subfamily)
MLFERYYKPLVLFAGTLFPDTGEAEDVVQDVFYHFLEKKIYLWIEAEALATYLFRSVKNGAMNKLRDGGRVTFLPLDALKLDVIEEESISFDPGIVNEIVAAIDRLPGKTAFVMRAVLLDRKKYKEVAELSGVSLNTVKTLLSHGMRTLREQFSSYRLLLFFFVRH